MSKELRDQAAHFAAACLILLPLALAPNVLTGALAGFGCGFIRELTEEGEVSLAAVRGALGSRLDLAFWTLGGAFAGVLAWL